MQVRSAFARAYSSLTDARAIVSLGSQKSILGTIIRPDPILLDRKGGSNGELTFNSLLPGAGESTPQFGSDKDTICNWQLLDDEPLPRGSMIIDGESMPARKLGGSRAKHKHGKIEKTESGSSGKKRRVRNEDYYGQNGRGDYVR
ncbi:hypothetical protein KSP40_PGU006371 [Platanthera guangdongensis]|uniref:Uncharacterized protein n=1 Tax=Platanthera guangdongensis TaxID=2320717 RepID=A0ABR2MFQ5_9ASPA